MLLVGGGAGSLVPGLCLLSRESPIRFDSDNSFTQNHTKLWNQSPLYYKDMAKHQRINLSVFMIHYYYYSLHFLSSLLLYTKLVHFCLHPWLFQRQGQKDFISFIFLIFFLVLPLAPLGKRTHSALCLGKTYWDGVSDTCILVYTSVYSASDHLNIVFNI